MAIILISFFLSLIDCFCINRHTATTSLQTLQRGQRCLPLHVEQGIGMSDPLPDLQIALGSLSCSVTSSARFGWANLIYADQPCLLCAVWELGGGCCLLIKNRLPSEVCVQTNSNGRHVTFCHSPFGISSRDFMCARVCNLISCIYPTAFFRSPKFWGKVFIRA